MLFTNLKIAKKTNNGIQHIGYCHCRVEYYPLVGSCLISQLSMHRQNVKMASKHKSSDSSCSYNTTKVFWPQLYGIIWLLKITSQICHHWAMNNCTRQEQNTDDTRMKMQQIELLYFQTCTSCTKNTIKSHKTWSWT